MGVWGLSTLLVKVATSHIGRSQVGTLHFALDTWQSVVSPGFHQPNGEPIDWHMALGNKNSWRPQVGICHIQCNDHSKGFALVPMIKSGTIDENETEIQEISKNLV